MRISDTTGHERTGRLQVADSRRAARGVVVTCPRSGEMDPRRHECVTRRAIAEKLAALKGYEYAGDHDPAADYDGKVYFVPAETLVGIDAAHAMGVRTEDDLFGGVVPFAFVGTKSITHPLAAGARRPAGWNGDFARLVRGAVLRGCAAFSRHDAQRGGERLLEHGAVRVKPAVALGGLGQTVVQDRRALNAALAELDPAELARCGVVVEQNLSEVVTYSVGWVCVADLVATYFGTQKLATDNSGAEVYGGSDLMVARGGFDELLQLDIDSGARRAIEQARIYDAATERCFPGFFASRRNYDIVTGRDMQGHPRCGVLEQSWRLGGASSAEIAALEAFRADPGLVAVRAESTELYDENAQVPTGATVYFRGADPTAGFLTKYATLAPHVYA